MSAVAAQQPALEEDREPEFIQDDQSSDEEFDVCEDTFLECAVLDPTQTEAGEVAVEGDTAEGTVTKEQLESVLRASKAMAKVERTQFSLSMRCYAILQHMFEKKSLSKTAEAVAKEFGVSRPQRITVSMWCKNAPKICREAAAGKSVVRLAGAGRPRACLNNEETAKKFIHDAQAKQERITRAKLKDLLGTTSDFAVNTFLKAHKLALRKANVHAAQTPEERDLKIQNFHTSCAALNALMPNLTADEIVQIDEIATSCCGLMTNQVETVAGSNAGAVAIQSCWLDSEKKFCTGVHFLSGCGFIPPIAFVKGRGRLKEEHCITVVATPQGCSRGGIFIEWVIPHLKKFAPTCRVVVMDSATSHMTSDVHAAFSAAGYWLLIIPGGVTSYIQALDTSYFYAYRVAHNKLTAEAMSILGTSAFKCATAKDKREIVFTTVAEAAKVTYNNLCSKIPSIFLSLGYLRPSANTICIRNLPSYKYVTVEENFIKKVAQSMLERRDAVCASITRTHAAVEKIVALRRSQSMRKEAEPPQLKGVVAVQPPCTCGHVGVGRHKKGCARAKRIREEAPVDTDEQQCTPECALDAVGQADAVIHLPGAIEENCAADPKEPAQPPRTPLKTPLKTLLDFKMFQTHQKPFKPPALLETLDVAPAKSVDHLGHVSFVKTKEIVQTCDGEVVLGVEVCPPKAEQKIWSCFQPGVMVTSREISEWIREISEFSPNALLIDTLQFKMMNDSHRRGEGFPRYLTPTALGWKCCAVVHYHYHFISLCYCPKMKYMWTFDSEPAYHEACRREAQDTFTYWLEAAGNVVQKTQLHPVRGIPVNDCGLFATNGIVKFLTGSPGCLTRDQMRERFHSQAFLFRYVAESASIPHYFFGEKCRHCQSTLKRAINREGVGYKACEHVRCIENEGSYRGRD